MDTRLLAFIGIATIITIAPGPDMALVTRVALARGKGAAWLTSCLNISSFSAFSSLPSVNSVTSVVKSPLRSAPALRPPANLLCSPRDEGSRRGGTR